MNEDASGTHNGLPRVDAGSRPASGRRPRRWLAWGVCGILLIVAAVAYRQFWLARPIGSGPAGPSVPRAPFTQVWTLRRVLVVGIGDSITAGLGAARPSHSLFNRLVRNPADEFPEMDGLCSSAVFPKIETRNIAVSGSTSLDHVDAIRTRLPRQDPATFGLVIMTTGGNDLIHWYGQRPPREGAMYGATLQQARPWIQAFQQRLDRMLDLIDERFPGGCQVFLADIYDPTDGVGDAPSVYLPAWPDGLAVHAAYNLCHPYGSATAC